MDIPDLVPGSAAEEEYSPELAKEGLKETRKDAKSDESPSPDEPFDARRPEAENENQLGAQHGQASESVPADSKCQGSEPANSSPRHV